MPQLAYRSSIDVSADDLFAWHSRRGAFERLTPPWAPITLEQFEGIREGQRTVLRIGLGRLALRWVAEHHGYVEGRQFRDRQVQGPFASWEHTHRMEPDGADASVLVDDLVFESPLGELGRLGLPLLRRELHRQFAYRHRITKQDLGLHRRYNPDGRRLHIAVSGASGFIGSNLVAFLQGGGHEVWRLVRRSPRDDREILWNPSTAQVEGEKLAGLDAVVHLAGENAFALRWSPDKKKRIYDSRIAGTKILTEALARLADPPKVFLCASAIGYYGDRGTERLPEDAAPASDRFFARVVHDWEAATHPARDAGIRTAQMRFGVVLSPAGGALRLMVLPFLLGLGGWVGTPGQYLSWAALDDVLGGIYHLLLTEGLEGPFNITTPEAVTMPVYAKTLGRVLGRPAPVHVPASVVRSVMGEAGDEIALSSVRAVPDRLQQSGYSFLYPDLAAALRHQLGRTLAPLDG